MLGQASGHKPLQGECILNETIDDLTVQFEENGQIIVNELDKVVLSKGLWTTILFRYQQWQPEKDDFGPDVYVIRRYKKSGGEYRQQSKFTISSGAGPQDCGRAQQLDKLDSVATSAFPGISAVNFALT